MPPPDRGPPARRDRQACGAEPDSETRAILRRAAALERGLVATAAVGEGGATAAGGGAAMRKREAEMRYAEDKAEGAGMGGGPGGGMGEPCGQGETALFQN